MDDAQLQRLLGLADKQELTELVMRYSQCLDRRDYETLRTLFTDDAVNVHGSDDELSVDEFIALVSDNDALDHTTHYVVQALFDVDGDTATGDVYKVTYNRTTPPDSVQNLWGSRSYDEFRRVDGVWKCSRRTIALDWSRSGPYDPTAAPPVYQDEDD